MEEKRMSKIDWWSLAEVLTVIIVIVCIAWSIDLIKEANLDQQCRTEYQTAIGNMSIVQKKCEQIVLNNNLDTADKITKEAMIACYAIAYKTTTSNDMSYDCYKHLGRMK